jgi:3-deoxy-D-manno-octulosonic-acid transferase
LSETVHALYTIVVIVLDPPVAVVCVPGPALPEIHRQSRGRWATSGELQSDGDESIWIHAVSVGEALTARALITDLRERYTG